MSYYKKIPVLDEKEQAEFDKYLTRQYQADLELAVNIIKGYWRGRGFKDYLPNPSNDLDICTVFDKLATPRIYLLQAWIHKRQQEAATSDEAWKEHPEDEKK